MQILDYFNIQNENVHSISLVFPEILNSESGAKTDSEKISKIFSEFLFISHAFIRWFRKWATKYDLDANIHCLDKLEFSIIQSDNGQTWIPLYVRMVKWRRNFYSKSCKFLSGHFSHPCVSVALVWFISHRCRHVIHCIQQLVGFHRSEKLLPLKMVLCVLWCVIWEISA